ncbi:MAG: hypothetical protein ACUZ8E_07020 [Candidatus Anammoxibacter sp.]
MKAKLISAFPGTGKTYYFNHGNKIIIDSDSSTFDKSDFPANYIRHIKDNLNKAEVILISSHKEVRDALVANKLEFTLVFPEDQLMYEYLQRFKDRGSPQAFIDLVQKNWYDWISELESQEGCERIYLGKGEYLIDVFKDYIF